MPKSVFIQGNGLSSVEAWFSTALDIEEVLVSCARDDQLHVMVADVINSFDTVDRSILDCTVDLGCLTGLGGHTLLITFVLCLNWLLASANHGVGMVSIPQGCPLSMVFVVALYVPWCRHLEVMPDVKPQLYADNLKCSAQHPGPSLMLLGLLQAMSELSVKMCHLASVFFLVPRSRSGGP